MKDADNRLGEGVTTIKGSFAPVYGPKNNLGVLEKCLQIKGLARAGLAATDSAMKVEDLIGSLGSVFEALIQMAAELEEEL